MFYVEPLILYGTHGFTEMQCFASRGILLALAMRVVDGLFLFKSIQYVGHLVEIFVVLWLLPAERQVVDLEVGRWEGRVVVLLSTLYCKIDPVLCQKWTQRTGAMPG